jgi:hypothetical protein
VIDIRGAVIPGLYCAGECQDSRSMDWQDAWYSAALPAGMPPPSALDNEPVFPA